MSSVQVSFFGVRGSTPCCAESLCGFGGNTSCVVIDADGVEPIVLDMGTGLREYGRQYLDAEPYVGSILLTHLHWDHVQGLPFFAPIHQPDARLTVYGPGEDGRPLGELFHGMMQPPYFPICCGDMVGDVGFRDVSADRFEIGAAQVTSAPVPHVGATNGYRVDVHGRSIAYIPDHQQPLDDPTYVDPAVLELAAGVDLLIHDAQYTPEQFARKSTWGHCTVDYACEVAAQAGAKSLALFHHDPENDDITLAALVQGARQLGASRGVAEVFGATEGETIKLS